MRAFFDCTLNFANTEKRGGAAAIISHRAVGYALADTKMAIEAVRSLSLRTAHAFDTQAPGAIEVTKRQMAAIGATKRRPDAPHARRAATRPASATNKTAAAGGSGT